MMRKVDQQLPAKPAPKARAFSEEQIRKFLIQASQEFGDVLISDPEQGKQEILNSPTSSVTSRQRPFGVSLGVNTSFVIGFSGDGVMENKSLEGIAQHYTLTRIVLAEVVLDPSWPLAA
jgi:hypothetical protein